MSVIRDVFIVFNDLDDPVIDVAEGFRSVRDLFKFNVSIRIIFRDLQCHSVRRLQLKPEITGSKFSVFDGFFSFEDDRSFFAHIRKSKHLGIILPVFCQCEFYFFITQHISGGCLGLFDRVRSQRQILFPCARDAGSIGPDALYSFTAFVVDGKHDVLKRLVVITQFLDHNAAAFITLILFIYENDRFFGL